MNLNLYLKTDKFSTNKEMVEYFAGKLSDKGVSVGEFIDEDYMFIFIGVIDGVPVNFYMGKNDEETHPPLWQIWPQQKVSFFNKLFGKPNLEPEEKAKSLLEEIANQIPGVQNVEWAI